MLTIPYKILGFLPEGVISSLYSCPQFYEFLYSKWSSHQKLHLKNRVFLLRHTQTVSVSDSEVWIYPRTYILVFINSANVPGSFSAISIFIGTTNQKNYIEMKVVLWYNLCSLKTTLYKICFLNWENNSDYCTICRLITNIKIKIKIVTFQR